MPLKLITSTPKKSLNAAFLKVRPLRTEIDLFKANLVTLIKKVDESEREENQKNHIRDFLVNTYYAGKREVNTKGTIDLVIHTDNTNKSPVGVIIEAKRPSNKSEWISADKPNGKALQELVLYYMRERVDAHNIDVKHIVITNIYEWYIIDAVHFDKLFYQNKKFVKDYESWRDGQKVTSDTSLFYNEIAKPYLEELTDEIPCTYFDIRTYEKELRNQDKADDNKLIELYKLLSEHHLLNVPFANDSNSLDKRFYTELLHIIGLTETKEGSKKLIGRHKEGERHSGTILEDAIIQIEAVDKLNRVANIAQYGSAKDERLFNISLELSITWINRILFLKLLEGQLVAYHRGDKDYLFLNSKTIREYDDLNTIFFQVLAKNHEERNSDVKTIFARVPYLNSSLFEPTELEHETILISNLRDEKTMPIHSQTVLKDTNGQKRTGTITALQYLFAFLDAYDFASEGSGDIQEDNKTLINASVLGLIFEKINGYKDGSFFTPGFITMYMCRETIRRAVVQKFNEAKGWNCADITDLHNRIEDRTEANAIVNSIKICDPAVGSGHFLVSALNEMIAIKSDLRILQDKDRKLLKGYTFEVINDELSIRDEDGDLYAYNPKNTESQRIQETLFHEKETIIESCLFGVDINPNSVKICRLRLWIELLKNAYYKAPDVLETLPNIDINIKCGNSLVSRFALDSDMSEVLKNAKQWSISTYRMAVDGYRNAKSKEEKREMESLINAIKSDFKSEVDKPMKKKISLARGLAEKLGQDIINLTLFGQKIDKKLTKDHEDAVTKLNKLEVERDDILSNKIYENAFEWRFEFPEVLSDEGEYLGFDVVIGNPPYVFARDNFNDQYKKYYYENFKGIDYQVNLYVLFAELTVNILQSKGYYSLIVPNSLLMVSSTAKIRKLLFTNACITEVVNFLGESFEGVNVETVSYFGVKGKMEDNIKVSIGEYGIIKYSHAKKTSTVLNSADLIMNVFSNDENDNFLIKLKKNTEILDVLVEIKAGLKAYEVGKGNPKQTREDVNNRIYDFDSKVDENTFPYLEGKDVQRYFQSKNSSFLRYGNNLAAPRTFDIFSKPKIIIREITGQHPKSIISCFSDEIVLFNMSNIAINQKESSGVELKYILALINSSLMSYYFQINTAKAVRKLFPKIILNDLRQFPIKVINIDDQRAYITLVDKIIDAKKQDPSADTTNLESQINQLVYELYGLTEDEIAIVEGREISPVGAKY